LNYAESQWDSMSLKFVDTGGLVPDTDDDIEKEIQVKSWSALYEADILIWVIDRKQNPDTITDAIMSRVWKLGKPVVIAINKVDDPNADRSESDYAKLGGVDFVNVSAVNGYGLNDLLDKIVAQSDKIGFSRYQDEQIIENQKTKRNYTKSKEVVQHKDGSYMVIRDRLENGMPGLYESYSSSQVEQNIPTLVFQIEGVLIDDKKIVISENKKTLENLISQDKELYFVTALSTESLQVINKEIPLEKLFKGGVVVKTKEDVMESVKSLIEEYDIEATSTLFVSDNERLVEHVQSMDFWTILHKSYYPLSYVIDRIDAMQKGFLEKTPKTPSIVLIGKPNVGKSSLLNALAEKDLQIVTDIAGTTLSVNDYQLIRTIHSKNSVSGEVASYTKNYTLLDTTGIRKPGQRTFGAESFATMRTIEAAYQADVVCLIFDGSTMLSHQDQVVAGIAQKSKNGIVVILNKCDLVDDEQKANYIRNFYAKFAFLKILEFVWVSAKEKENLDSIWRAIDNSLYNRERHISKDQVRKLFNYLMKQKPPKKLRTKKRPVIYDLVYTSAKPPTFELLIKDKTTVHWSYVRFLENIIRNQFGFTGTGIKLKLVEVSRRSVEKE
jgi:small GTP-binding protein